LKYKLKIALASLAIFSSAASAQTFSNMIFFGDSNTDSGRYKYIPSTVGGSLATYGAFVTNPGPEWSVGLGQRFGITVTPSDAPGGGNNYAAGGARVSYTAVNSNAWSATTQVSSYLSSTGGIADPNALYTVSIGINDLKTTTTGGAGNIVSPENTAALISLGQQTASLVSQLHSAGARNFVIPNMNSFLTPEAATASGYTYNATTTASRGLYSSTVWNTVASQGINFIPVDWNTVYNYVLLNPAQFGITNTNVNTPACGPTVGSLNCGPANYVTPNAQLTYFYADGLSSSTGGGHLTTAVQQIETDYFYELIVAPSQVSMLGNQAALGQIAVNNSYMDQVGYSFRANASKTLGAWVLGGTQQVNITGSQTSTSSTPYNGAAGMDYQYNENLLVGGFVGYGQAQVNFNSAGNFTQSGTTLGLYSGYRSGEVWVNGMANYNWLNSNLNRVTPIGITSFSNASTINGFNTSIAAQTGYDFEYDSIVHGPLIGYTYVNTYINGFAESGNFTSLQFGSQNINSQVGSVGYQAQSKYGDWLPFAKAVYNSELGNMDRLVTTSLTTISAPSYTMPAIGYGRNWTNLTAGIGYQIDPKTVIRASFTQQVSQQSVNAYTAVVSLNAHF